MEDKGAGLLIDPDSGPFAIEGDSWDQSTPEHGSNESYRGIRRARGQLRRLWVVSLAVLIGLAAFGLVERCGGSADLETGGASPEIPPAVAGRPGDGSPGEASDAVEPLPSGVAATAQVRTGAPPFAPVTFEAEAGPPAAKLRGSAKVVPMAGASGGQVVRGIGNWEQDQGSIQLRGLTVPTNGVYRVALTYVADESSAGRTAALEVGSVSATATFAGGSGCCAVVSVDIVLTAGTYTITLTNENSGVPAIDKIVISRP